MKSVLLDLIEQDRPRVTALFDSRTHEEGDCLVWHGKKRENGYGIVDVRHPDSGRWTTTSAHRAAWLIANGPIADPALVLDHLCRNRSCVRVSHLELVTSKENTNRGLRTPALGPRVTHCPSGHEYDETNTLYNTSKRTGYTVRYCRECTRRRSAEARAKRKLLSAR